MDIRGRERQRTRRRAGSPVTSWVAAAAVGLVTVVVGGQVAQAALGWETPTAPANKGVKVVPVKANPRPAWSAAKREVTEADVAEQVPAATTARVSLIQEGTGARLRGATASRRVGQSPIYLSAHDSGSGLARGTGVRVVDVSLASAQSAAKAGVNGLLLSAKRADGQAASASVDVTVDYAAFAGAIGGDSASRLRFLSLPDGRPMPTRNDQKRGTVSATVTLPDGGGIVSFAVGTGADGVDGTYAASSLTADSTWTVSPQMGGFTWNYPIKVPDAVGGPAPNLSLAYSSLSVDGRTSGTNAQGSWIGDGWDMWSGYIERSYRPCDVDKKKSDDTDTDADGKEQPNNVDVLGGDQCWFNFNASMSLNGGGGELVRQTKNSNSKHIVYRNKKDNGSTIEWIKGDIDNGDEDKSYWKVTTVDGIQYFFGRSSTDGGTSDGAKTNSVWTQPVYSNHPGEPGYDKSFAKSGHDRAWRWNLDYVKDLHGNTMTYFYKKEAGAYAREGDKDKRTEYTRGGWLDKIEYGSRENAGKDVHPAARILFNEADRCVAADRNSCFKDGKPVKSRFPDTPWDLYCQAKPCTTFSPSFWTQKRLDSITAQVYSGSGDSYTNVSHWRLNHTYLAAGVNEGKPMWLKGITYTGLSTSAGGSAVTDPEVVFDPGADVLPNRVDGPNDGRSSLFRNRIAAITTESGSQIGITYSAPQCQRGHTPAPAANTMRCFPQWYGTDGETPTLDWFHRYVVERVDVYDNTGGFQHEQTNYDYVGTPAWAFDDSEIVRPDKRTWGQYRGYDRVVVHKGLATETQTVTDYRYFRGMDGDKQPNEDKDKEREHPGSGEPREVTVKDSLGGTYDDDPAFAGMELEQTNLDGANWISGIVSKPVKQGPTAQTGRLSAFRTNVGQVRKRLRMSDGSTRWTKQITSYDDANLPVQVSDLGDEATAADDRCLVTGYARNDGLGILDRVNRVETRGVNCDVKNPKPADILSEVRTYYDNPSDFGATPTRGLARRVERLVGWSGTTRRYQNTAETSYDANGRPTSAKDAKSSKATTTQYLPQSAGPLTKTVVTNPVGALTSFMDTALGLPVKTVGVNNSVTELNYDGQGRLLAVWKPGHSKADFPATPNAKFDYSVRNDRPSTVTSSELTGYGSTNYRTTVALFDGLLRTRQVQEPSPSGGRTIADTVMDSRGLVKWTSRPYYDASNSAPDRTLVTTEGRAEIPAVTRNEYDGAGRITAVVFETAGDEQWRTTTIYAGEKTSVLPPVGGTATTSIADARGKQSELRQYTDAAMVGKDDAVYRRTTYGFDKLGQLTSVVDPARNRWDYTFDLAGNRIAERDPDHGAIQTGYDAVGNISWVKDARGSVIDYTYDDAGRKTSVRDGDPTDPGAATGPLRAQWVYDEATLGVGKLSKSIRYAKAGDSSSAYVQQVSAYDQGGRATDGTTTVPQSSGFCSSGNADQCSYTARMTFRPNGDAYRTFLPAAGGLPAEALTTEYTSLGQAAGLRGELGGTSQIYVDSVIYDQLGFLSQRVLGSGQQRLWLTNVIDSATGRLTSANAVPLNKADIYDLHYTYDQTGNVTQINDTPNGGQKADNQCFGYDAFGELTNAWTPGGGNCQQKPDATALGGPAPYWNEYRYDSAGNRTQATVHGAADQVSSYTYPGPAGAAGSQPHAVTGVDTVGGGNQRTRYAYDASGNMICRPVGDQSNVCPTSGNAGANSQIVTWDAEGHAATVKDAGGESSFVYDADGKRIVRNDPDGATLYLPNGLELRLSAKAGAKLSGTRYYSHGGGVIAIRNPAGLTWVVNDHHGTATATITDNVALKVTRRYTTPFGEVRGGTATTLAGDKGFVGGTVDPSGLTHIGAREYDPRIGKFISVDPVMDMTDPSNWNPYSYGKNSPVSVDDPTGLAGRDSRYPEEKVIPPQKPADTGGNQGNNNGPANLPPSTFLGPPFIPPKPRDPLLDKIYKAFFGDKKDGDERTTVRTNAVAPGNGVVLMRFFIKEKEAAFGYLSGDDRGVTSDPDARYRMAVAWDTETGNVSFTVAQSCRSGWNRCNGQDAISKDGANSVSIEQNAGGLLKVGFGGLNSKIFCCSVEGDVRVDLRGGHSRVQLHGDDYPNFEAWQYRDNHCPMLLASDVQDLGGMHPGASTPFWVDRHLLWNDTVKTYDSRSWGP